jgi:hypothetical protein
MFQKTIPLGISIVIILSLVLAACSANQTSTVAPTLDTKLVYTQAAQTVEAGIQMTQAARPPATATPEPTATLEPTATQSAPADATATQALPAGDPAAPAATPTTQENMLPTATTAAAAGGGAAQPSGDKCEWVDQSPKDGSLVKKNASWDMTIVIRNAGTTTWDKTYALKFWGGDRLGSPGDFFVVNEVKPGEMYRFLFTMKAPDSIGKKQANWVVQTGNGVNFCPLFLEVEVVD